jgi:hypothetical protein
MLFSRYFVKRISYLESICVVSKLPIRALLISGCLVKKKHIDFWCPLNVKLRIPLSFSETEMCDVYHVSHFVRQGT